MFIIAGTLSSNGFIPFTTVCHKQKYKNPSSRKILKSKCAAGRNVCKAGASTLSKTLFLSPAILTFIIFVPAGGNRCSSVIPFAHIHADAPPFLTTRADAERAVPAASLYEISIFPFSAVVSTVILNIESKNRKRVKNNDATVRKRAKNPFAPNMLPPAKPPEIRRIGELENHTVRMTDRPLKPRDKNRGF